MDAGRARLLARLECDLRARRFRLATNYRRATSRPRSSYRPANGNRVSDNQRLAVRNFGQGITRYRSRALLKRIFHCAHAIASVRKFTVAMLQWRDAALSRRR